MVGCRHHTTRTLLPMPDGGSVTTGAVDVDRSPGSGERTAFGWAVAAGVTGWIVLLVRVGPRWSWPIGVVAVLATAAVMVAWVVGRTSPLVVLDVVTFAVAAVGLTCAARVDPINQALTLSGSTGIVCLLAWIVLLVRRRPAARAGRWIGFCLAPLVAFGSLALIPTAFNLRVAAAGDTLNELAASVLLHVGPDGEPTEQVFEPPVEVGTFHITAVYFVPSREVPGGREIRFVTDEAWSDDLVYVESGPGVPGHWGRAQHQS